MFDWSMFLRLAGELVECDQADATSEASWRSGTSRAYYAAYHAVRDYVRECEPLFASPRGDSHQALIDFVFRLHVYSKEHRQIATNLKRLRDRRNDADYERTPNCTRPNARMHVQDANVITELIVGLRRKRGISM